MRKSLGLAFFLALLVPLGVAFVSPLLAAGLLAAMFGVAFSAHSLNGAILIGESKGASARPSTA